MGDYGKFLGVLLRRPVFARGASYDAANLKGQPLGVGLLNLEVAGIEPACP